MYRETRPSEKLDYPLTILPGLENIIILFSFFSAMHMSLGFVQYAAFSLYCALFDTTKLKTWLSV